MTKLRTTLSSSLLLLMVLALFCSGEAWAQAMKKGTDALSSLAFVSDRLQPSQPFVPLEDVQSAVPSAIQNGWAAWRLGTTTEWRATVDKRTGLIGFAEGGNIGWIPGRGNSLTADDISAQLKGKKRVDMAAMESIARAYLPQVASLLGIDPKALVLNRGRSGQ
ncbi:MAG TPA: hypothetical protein VOA87_19290, partial [Thermoanaerobaculia bacterium]|nr:hypothetical protein [Thermoanaerobaculia bacterium]